MPYIAGFGVYSVFATPIIIDMTVFIVVDGMMLTEFRRMDVLKIYWKIKNLWSHLYNATNFMVETST